MSGLVRLYLEYDTERDFNGSKGPALASAISRKSGYNLQEVKRSVNEYDPNRVRLEQALKRLGKAIFEKESLK